MAWNHVAIAQGSRRWPREAGSARVGPKPALCVLSAAVVVSVLSCGPDLPEVVDVPPGEGAEVMAPILANPKGSAAVRSLVEAQIRRDPQPLVEALRSEEGEVVKRAAFALASIQDRNAEPAIAVRLNDPREGVAAAAAFALGRTAGDHGAEALLGALESTPPGAARMEMIESLGFAAGEGQLGRLLAVEWAGEELATAAQAVSRMGIRGVLSEESLDWLVERLAHPDPDVRTGAAYFFSRAPEAEDWRTQAPRVREALTAMEDGEAAVRFLLPGLAALGDTEDTPAFVHWTRASGDWRTRSAAVAALRDRLGDRAARDAALAALEDPSPHVVEAAAGELGRSRPALQAVQERVVAWLEANSEQWQPAALLWSGLAPLGEGERIVSWLDAMPADNVLARAAAVESLSRVPGPEHLDRLLAEAKSEADPVAAAAYRGLAAHFGSYRDDAALLARFDDAFRDGLGRSHPTIVGTAARGLTDPVLLEGGSAPILESALLARDPSDPADAPAAAAIVTALAQTRDTTWVSLLQRYLDHPQSQVRVAAREAIESLTLRPVPAAPRVADGRPELNLDWEAFPDGRPSVVLETTQGLVRVVLAHEEAPLTVQTFLALAEAGAHDGVPFHRVVPGFVVQGGDVGRLDGTGGPGFSIRTELTRIPFDRGVIGMASAGRDTEGSQFFLMHGPAPHLEDRYTSFGWVVEGMEVVDRLLRGDRVLRAEVVPPAGG